MKTLMLALMTLTTFSSCTENFEVPQPDPVFNIAQAAGREAPTPGDHITVGVAPEPVETDAVDVGVTKAALNVCYAAKTKAKARQNCWGYWVENAYEMRIENGLCPGSNHYLIFDTNDQPSSGVRFEVDYKVCKNGTCGWKFKEQIRCSCDNAACVKEQ